MKSLYILSPILLGSKSKSVAVIIPAKVARAFDITDTTVLALKPEEISQSIRLEKLDLDG